MNRIRENLGEITQKELAEEIGATEASISRYVNGSRVPRVTTALKIAKILDKSVYTLFGNPTSDYRLGYSEAVKQIRDLVNKDMESLKDESVANINYMQRVLIMLDLVESEGANA